MKHLKSVFLSLFLLALPLCFGKGYEVIENKATLPLLDPTFAERRVAKIQLENGLKAYLVSDPETKQSAASLSVEVGSWDNPEEYQGMAHFLEHMLFMGTKTYPEERAYWQYIRDHGGSANAFTANDRTVYYFSINNDWFEGAIDRFSHFFVDPLLATSSLERELHAVDQEFSNSIEHDGWREAMIFKETGNPHHPNRLFSCGNAEILRKIPSDVLKKWYETHYSAKIMHLTVISPLPLDELVQMAAEKFAQVPAFTPTFKRKNLPLTSSKQKGRLTYIAPIKDLRQLTLQWEIPTAFVQDFETKPAQFVAFALAHEGEKSLISELQKEQLAEDLTVVCDSEGKEEMLFRISVDLTHQGLAQIDTVIERCFQAIARLKTTGVPHSLFQDMQKVTTINYQYQSRTDAFRQMYHQGYSIIDEDLATYPEKTHIPTTYNPGTLTSFIQTLTPQSCLFYLQADPELTSVKMENKEKWLRAEYTVKEIPPSKLLSWQEVNLHPHIDLPEANPFLPEKFDLVTNPDTAVKPHLIYDQNDGKVYFKADKEHLVPELALYTTIKSPHIDETPSSGALLDLYLVALSDQLRARTYFAKQAGYSVKFSDCDLALTLSISGFNDKAPVLIKEIFKKMKGLTITPQQLELYKQLLASEYENTDKVLPLKQAMNLIYSLVSNTSPLAKEKLRALTEMTYDDFSNFSKDLLKKVYLETTLTGNLTQNDATALSTEIREILHATPYAPKEHKKKQVLTLSDNEGPFVLEQTTPRQGNGVVLLLEQGSFTFEKRAAQDVLGSALDDDFFDTLRTKQQTGYIAQSWTKEDEKQLFQYFGVQSSTHSPTELLARYELFLEDFLRNFQTYLPESRFETIKAAQITKLKMPPKNLNEMAGITHRLAFHYDGDFNWLLKRAEAVKDLTYDKLQAWAQAFLSRENTKRIAILMEGAPAQEKPFKYKNLAAHEIGTHGRYITSNFKEDL